MEFCLDIYGYQEYIRLNIYVMAYMKTKQETEKHV